jgi:hypothetical protein
LRQPVYAKLEVQLEAAVGDISSLQLAGSDEAARTWIVDNRDVLGSLSSILLE